MIAICVDFSHISTKKHSSATDSVGRLINRCLYACKLAKTGAEGEKGFFQGVKDLHELWQEKLDFRYGKLFQFAAKIVLNANIVWIAKQIRDSNP